MFDRASRKLGLEQAVLGTFEKEKDDDKPTSKEMEQLLKKGAYALLDDDNDEVTQQFCADDIENILAKRTRTRVVEGTKTATWLNKQGISISKTKFSAETGDSILDMDDPLFWQKVMPDFVTPSIMLKNLNELCDEVDGIRRVGRGGARKKKAMEAKAMKDAEDEDMVPVESGKVAHDETANGEGEQEAKDGEGDEEVDVLIADETLEELPEGEDDAGDSKKTKFQLSRTNQKKVAKFMSDLKGMMEGILDDEEDEGISESDRTALQKLLLTISVKERMFSEIQRSIAKTYLKQMEGGRRRRCRASELPKPTPSRRDEGTPGTFREELQITKSKKIKRKRRKRPETDADDPEAMDNMADKESTAYLGEDGYLHHSDSEADWSDVAEDLYIGKKKDRISSKEANRRRAWAAGVDPTSAAAMAWPVFPRNFVKPVLSSLLKKVMEYDAQNGGGVFSEPVSREDFPEYYDQIEKPMDYGTMKVKLENDEYRSAQAMQKDFILYVKVAFANVPRLASNALSLFVQPCSKLSTI
jgi:Bromodomain